MSGPFETERQARETPEVRAVYAAFDRAPGVGQMIAPNTGMLTQACEAAGVELGAYDRRIVEWLAGWEPATCVVIAGLISRAAAGLTLASAQAEVLGKALTDAIVHREPTGFCRGCELHPAGLCGDHGDDLDRCEEYLKVARELGIEVDR